MIYPKVRAFCDANQAKNLEELKVLLRFQSVSAQSLHHGDCESCATWLADHLGGLGFTTDIDTSPAKPCVLATSEPKPDRPTLLVYGHYDVQPAEPLELWHSDPFEPVVRDGMLIARGSSDDKGQVYAWVKAAEAYLQAGSELPLNLKFLIEGEEEVGSPTLEPFVAGNIDRLACDYIAISDSHFYAAGVPCVNYGMRGLVYIEVTLTGPNRDLHSGEYGGAVVNPINALACLIAGMHDQQGRVTLPGFYDDVLALAPSERAAWARLGYDEQAEMESLGVDALAGEAGFNPIERRWARPTSDCNGIWGGYTGEGPKTIIGSWAKAKISSRLVPDQDPAKVVDAYRQYFRDNRPPGTKIDVEVFSVDKPWHMSVDSPALSAASAAMTEAYGAPCQLIRGGGTVPITAMFQEHLCVDPLMMGFGGPDDLVHSPNERMPLANYYGGILAAAALMGNLAGLGK